MEETNGGFQTLVYEDDLHKEEYPPYHQSNRIQGIIIQIFIHCTPIVRFLILLTEVGFTELRYNDRT